MDLTILRVLMWPFMVGVVLAAVLWIVFGSVAGYSALLGSLTCVVPNAFLGLRIMAPRRDPGALKRAAWIGEIGKLAVTVIGFVLVYIFEAESGLLISGILVVMLLAASWVALNTARSDKPSYYPASLAAVALGGLTTLALITQGVLQLDPWYRPNTMIPLAGMIFSASMTNISLALERLESELGNGVGFREARDTAFRASMIPVINSLFAVGLIALPGMMTGQILSGVSPLIAVRYQIMVMCMIFGAAGLSSVCFLWLVQRRRQAPNP